VVEQVDDFGDLGAYVAFAVGDDEALWAGASVSLYRED
jgi:hypothetical protein